LKNSFEKYGQFSDDNLEFIINRPDTPVPWVNYISNGDYSGLVSNSGGGYSFYKNPKDNRITRWRYNGLPADRPGRYLLLRDKDSGEYWSATWQPVPDKCDSYECRHGLYYSKITTIYRGIRTSVLFFVPENDDLEIWHYTIKNESEKKIELDLFTFQELCLGHALVDLINQPNDQHFNEVTFHPEQQILTATKRYWVKYNQATVKQANEDWDKLVYFASSFPVKSWDGSKRGFIGKWRSESNPIAVENGLCSNSNITSGDAIAALHSSIELEPGEQKEFSIFMGIVQKDKGYNAVIPVVEKYRDLKNVEESFQRIKSNWRNYLSSVHVQTPDPSMNRMLNVWNQYQTSVTFRFSRDASYHHGGLLFGRGYRDSCQDIMGPVMAKPEWVKARILEMCQYQFKAGKTYHCYYPGTGGGEQTGHSDTPLWLPLAIMTYLKETGDVSFIKVKVPYADAPEEDILHHLYAAIDYTLANLTPRKLAKFGPGDWNDTLDYMGRGGKGESVWVSMFLAYILKDTVDLCRYIGHLEKTDFYIKKYNEVKTAINTHCWDGNWYIRGTNDQGEIVGSDQNDEGKIFLNTQSWAVISGVADGERASLCMQSVRELMDTPKGPKILHPAYTKVDNNIGLATRCVPGKKENGAVFNHPVSWAILAECLLGHGDRAFEIYQKALPMNPVVDIDRYEVEPYVYAEYVTSPDHSTEGQASHSWLTGSSTWMLRDGIDYILGVQPTYFGLKIDPCIPKEWTSYNISRKFQGIIYNILVTSVAKVNKGNVTITVEGTPIDGDIIRIADPKLSKLLSEKSSVNVTVELT